MGTRDRIGIGIRELGAAVCFLASVGLGAWVIRDAWWSGAVTGLGVGLLVAGFVHLLGQPRRDEEPAASPRWVARPATGDRRRLVDASPASRSAPDTEDIGGTGGTSHVADGGWDPVAVHRTFSRQPAGRAARPG